MDNELALRLFVSVVDEGSFSNGGARLGVPQSTTSRMMSKLEERLGARLLQRSTRSITLTEAGQIYYERAGKIVTELDEAASAIHDISKAPAGLLRITAPSSFGRLFIAPCLSEFKELYPDITIGLSLTDVVEDVIALGYDIAIRMGELSDSGLVTRNLATSTSTICASPGYVEKHGMPKSVADLKHHNCLQFRSSPGRNRWEFTRNDCDFEVKVSGSFYSNNGDALLAAALTGLGVVYLPDWMVGGSLVDGSLVRILPDFQLKNSETPIQTLFAHRNHIPAKVRAFATFFQSKLSAEDWSRYERSK